MKIFSVKILASLAIVVLTALLLTPRSYADEYLVGDGDLLRIKVYEHDDLETEIRIGGDGKITFPLIGEVEVQRLSTAEIEKKLARLLGDGYLKNPHVTVFIEEYKSKKVTVLGEFHKPGLIELTGNSTLVEVISNAGGVTEDAGDTLYIQRKKPGSDAEGEEEMTVTVDLKRLLEEGDVSANREIKDGDSIYVPRAAFVYVSGEVEEPGAYKITKGLTVLKAITLAGGFTEKAWRGRTKIIRKKKDGKEETIKVEMDAPVKSEDVILVPESFF